MSQIVAILFLDFGESRGHLRIGPGIPRLGGHQAFRKGEGSINAVDNPTAVDP